MKKQKGFAALLIIFILGMVSILVASGLVLTGYNESQMARSGASGTAAYYVANSGIEDAMYKIKTITGYGLTPTTYPLPVDDGSASVSVSPVVGNIKQRTVDSIGTKGTYVSRIHVLVNNTTGIDKAIQAGLGGFEMKKGKIYGDVHSDLSILGKSNSCNPSSGSIIYGFTEASNTIDTLCINGDASASVITPSTVVNGTPKIFPTPPPPLPFPLMADITTFENTMPLIASEVHSDCKIGGSPDCSTIDGSGIPTIGNQIIDGNLTFKPSVNHIKINGPIWVKGTGTITFPTTIDYIGTKSDFFRTDAKIHITAGSTINTTGTNILLLLAMSSETSCTAQPAISIDSNITANHIVFFAPNGCVNIQAGASDYLTSVMGYKVYMDVNTVIRYDNLLKNVIFYNIDPNKWQIASFSQN